MTVQPERPALLAPGAPLLGEYERVVASAELAEMLDFSSSFRARHLDLVGRDPLEQWSRRWEYPFAFQALEAHFQRASEPPCRLLDAGSGFTFFPFFVAERLAASVTCVDATPALADAFRRAAAAGASVEFRPGDVGALTQHGDASFDAVVCLSVLEHVPPRARGDVVSELRRVLRPGGLLVLTFDVAIDGDYEIPRRGAESLLETLAEHFGTTDVPGLETLDRPGGGQDLLTTRRIAASEPWRMPWSGRLASTLGSLRHGFVPRSFGYRNLTVWCGRLVRADEDAARSQ